MIATRPSPPAMVAARCLRSRGLGKRAFRNAPTTRYAAPSHVPLGIGGEDQDSPAVVSPPLQSRKEVIRNAKPFSDFLTDSFNRQHDYLRISVTERCNLRCLYCMPEEGIPLSPPAHMLTSPEIFYLSSLFVSQGVTKIRLTGGEPTVRRDIVPLMQQIGSLRPNGLRELAITTNGISLHRKLDAMVEAGLTGVNMSLDTLDPFQFQIMTRRNGFSAVMKSIDRILEMNKLGANVKLKVNCVVMRGMNERDIIPFVEMGREKDIEVRFIEYMPFGGNKWSEGKMMSFQEMLGIIRAKYPDLKSLPGHKNDTSKTFAVPGFVGKVGFITSMTNDFCGTCNRLRITSDGNIKVCLHGNAEVSLRDILRKDNDGEPIDQEAFERIKQIEMDRRDGLLSDESNPHWVDREQELLQVIGAAVKRKAEKHADMGDLEKMQNRPMILIDQASQPRAPTYASSWGTPNPRLRPFLKHATHGPWLSQSWSHVSASRSPPILPMSMTVGSSAPFSVHASRQWGARRDPPRELKFNGLILVKRNDWVAKFRRKHVSKPLGERRAEKLRLRLARELRQETRQSELALRPNPQKVATLEEIRDIIRPIEMDRRQEEEDMLRLLHSESDEFVKAVDFDHLYREYWYLLTTSSTITHKYRKTRNMLTKMVVKLGLDAAPKSWLDQDKQYVRKMGSKVKSLMVAGFGYKYNEILEKRPFDQNIISVFNGKASYVPTHRLRSKVAELRARIELEKLFSTPGYEPKEGHFRTGPWILHMHTYEQKLVFRRFELLHNPRVGADSAREESESKSVPGEMESESVPDELENDPNILKLIELARKDADSRGKNSTSKPDSEEWKSNPDMVMVVESAREEWKSNLDAMESNLAEFERELKRRLRLIAGPAWISLQKLQEARQHEKQQQAEEEEHEDKGAKASPPPPNEIGPRTTLTKRELKVLRNEEIAVEAMQIAAAEKLAAEANQKAHAEKQQTSEYLSADLEQKQEQEQYKTRLAEIVQEKEKLFRMKEMQVQELRRRRAALAQEQASKIAQRADRLALKKSHSYLNISRLVPNSQKALKDADRDQDSDDLPSRSALSQHRLPSDGLKASIPSSGIVRIDDLTVNFEASGAELQSQLTRLCEILKTKDERLSVLPFDISASSNPNTIKIWLKILVHKWQRHVESKTWHRGATETQPAQPKDAYYGTAKVDEDVAKVLDHMVNEQGLDFEAAQRMASRWEALVARKTKPQPKPDPEAPLDDEWDNSGMGWLKDDRPLEVMESPRETNPVLSTTVPQAFGKDEKPRGAASHYPHGLGQIRHYSSSRQGPPPSLPHLTPEGNAHMVSVAAKPHTLRTAIATGTVHFSNPTPLHLIRSNSIKKGDVLSVSRIAGIMAAKKCPDLIPLCHPILLTHVGVELSTFDGAESGNPEARDASCGGVVVEAKVQCEGQTGVEMEALSSVMGAALTVVDMCKAVDKGMRIEGVRVVLKEGGRSGTWKDEKWVSVIKD